MKKPATAFCGGFRVLQPRFYVGKMAPARTLVGQAGGEGFEPPARGFGSRCSGQAELTPINWTVIPLSRTCATAIVHDAVGLTL